MLGEFDFALVEGHSAEEGFVDGAQAINRVHVGRDPHFGGHGFPVELQPFDQVDGGLAVEGVVMVAAKREPNHRLPTLQNFILLEGLPDCLGEVEFPMGLRVFGVEVHAMVEQLVNVALVPDPKHVEEHSLLFLAGHPVELEALPEEASLLVVADVRRLDA